MLLMTAQQRRDAGTIIGFQQMQQRLQSGDELKSQCGVRNAVFSQEACWLLRQLCLLVRQYPARCRLLISHGWRQNVQGILKTSKGRQHFGVTQRITRNGYVTKGSTGYRLRLLQKVADGL